MRREGATYVRTRSEHNDCHEHKLRHLRSVTILAPRISQYILTSYCASNGSPPCRNMPASKWHSPSWKNTNSDTWWEQEDEDRLRGSFDGSRGSSWHGGGGQSTADPAVSDCWWTPSSSASSNDHTRTSGWHGVSRGHKGGGKGWKGKHNCGDHQPGKGNIITFKSPNHAFYKDFPASDGRKVPSVEVPWGEVEVLDSRKEIINGHEYVAVLVDVGDGVCYWSIFPKTALPG